LLTVKTGYTYEEGGIYAKDGKCATFDASATGTTPGNGCVVFSLKSLEDAVRDRDTIHAVISGTALNNDGHDSKVGFTAPSVEGQYQVISQALNQAGISAETISYVEAHGTATALGDVVEVSALEKAFAKSTKKQFCALGSVKSSIGHCDTAAGAASLLKTVLALEHKTIPATLHFTTLNPKLKLDSTPFYVANKSTPWPEHSGTISCIFFINLC
jgi:phthiocerol/phenolphthiocerol synthesis type-I polyketide synthase E